MGILTVCRSNGSGDPARTVWKWWPGEVGEGLLKRLCSRSNVFHLNNERMILILGQLFHAKAFKILWALILFVIQEEFISTFFIYFVLSISSSLTLIWHHFGIKDGTGGVPRSSLRELGVNFLEV